MLSIRSNIASLDAATNLNNSSEALTASMDKLSSGYRITSAADDAAGLGISTNLEAQIASYNQAGRNAQDGLSLSQTAEGALNETSNILSRLRELAMESSSDGVGNTERAYVQDETTQLTTEIQRISQATEYNGTSLLSGGGTTLTFQIGIRNSAANDQINVATADATASTLGVSGLDLSTKTSAQAALSTIDSAIDKVSSIRSTFGAVSNRLQSVSATISDASDNLTAADSRIRDVDVASETANMSRENVLEQAGVSVLAQANQVPQLALKLLG